MAKTSMIVKSQRPAKYSTRQHNRCKICGRPTLISVNMVYVVYASGSLPIRDNPESRKQAGKQLLSKGG